MPQSIVTEISAAAQIKSRSSKKKPQLKKKDASQEKLHNCNHWIAFSKKVKLLGTVACGKYIWVGPISSSTEYTKLKHCQLPIAKWFQFTTFWSPWSLADKKILQKPAPSPCQTQAQCLIRPHPPNRLSESQHQDLKRIEKGQTNKRINRGPQTMADSKTMVLRVFSAQPQPLRTKDCFQSSCFFPKNLTPLE